MNKKNIIIIGIISVLAIILIVGGLLLSMNSSKENNKLNKEENNQQVSKEKELGTEEYYKYYSNIQEAITYFNLNLMEQYPIQNINEMSAEQKTAFLLKNTVKMRGEEISLTDLNKEKNKYFKEFELVQSDIKEKDKILYKYSSEKYTYNNLTAPMCNLHYKEETNKGYKNSWIVKTKVYYTTPIALENNQPVYGAFATLDDCNNQKNEIKKNTGSEPILTDEEYKKVKDNLETYTYTFEKYNDNYIMKSIVNS